MSLLFSFSIDNADFYRKCRCIQEIWIYTGNVNSYRKCEIRSEHTRTYRHTHIHTHTHMHTRAFTISNDYGAELRELTHTDTHTHAHIYTHTHIYYIE